jgi:MoxR-like ATPase
MTKTLTGQSEAQKMRDIENELNLFHVERTEEIRGLSLAIIANTNVLLLGDPGVGKSLLIKDFSKRIVESDYFEWLVGKFTTPDELFGTYSLTSLQEGKFERHTEGMLSEAHVVFLDEIWKCNNGVINSLLSVMNERVFHNHGKQIKVPTILLAGASNELPEANDHLDAALDRFILKFKVDTIQEDANLVKMMQNSLEGTRVKEASITLDEVHTLQKLRSEVTVPLSVLKAFVKIKNALRSEGLEISPRMANQSMKIVQANALLEGRKEAEIDDLETLVNVLWRNDDDIPLISAKVYANISSEAEKIIEEFSKATNVMDKYKKAFNEHGTSEGNYVHFIQDLVDVRDRLDEIKDGIVSDGKSTKTIDKKINTIDGWVKRIFSEGHGIHDMQV